MTGIYSTMIGTAIGFMLFFGFKDVTYDYERPTINLWATPFLGIVAAFLVGIPEFLGIGPGSFFGNHGAVQAFTVAVQMA